MSTNFVSDIIENHSNESSMLTLTESRIGTHLLEQGYCIMSAKNSNIENLDAMKLLQKALKEN